MNNNELMTLFYEFCFRGYTCRSKIVLNIVCSSSVTVDFLKELKIQNILDIEYDSFYILGQGII